ncbi:MAG TPA: MoaD/ThiS family protein [bacterium]|nr:MoaD/ThiS family protein [bacterium]
MKIKLKLFAMLASRLPPGSEDHTMELEVPEGTTPRQVVERLNIPRALATLALVDGVHLTAGEIEAHPLHEGETLAIFPPIAGG